MRYKELNLSTPEGQKVFDELPLEERERLIHRARQQAEMLKLMVERGVAQSYAEAYEKAVKYEEEPIPSGYTVDREGQKYTISIAENGDFLLDAGGGPICLGNIFEGRTYSVDKFGNETINIESYQDNLDKILQNLDQLVIRKPEGSA